MARLTERHKEFVVTRLARFDSPSDVRDALKERFGLDASLDQIVYYNPETANGSDRLAEHLKELFHRTREQYLSDTSAIPAAHKAYRIRQLHEAAQEAKKGGNYPLMASLLEQIAKEVGGAYTNLRYLKHTGADGGPIKHHNVNATIDLTDTDDPAELMRKYEELFAFDDD